MKTSKDKTEKYQNPVAVNSSKNSGRNFIYIIYRDFCLYKYVYNIYYIYIYI